MKLRVMRELLVSCLMIMPYAHARVSPFQGSSAVTYDLNGGRLGDNLVTYIKARWIAYTNDLPFLYVPFAYSDQLMMHELDTMYEEKKHRRHFTQERHIWCHSEESVVVTKDSRTLYFVYNGTRLTQGDIVDIHDQDFIDVLKRVLKPRNGIVPYEFPVDTVTVALHVRKGGGYDPPLLADGRKKGQRAYADVRWPLRFPPDEFYVQQIQKVLDMFPGHLLYVHIFTDDKEPERLVKQFQQALGNPPVIRWAYRAHGNHHDAHVVADLFAMTQFDCLIRPDSCYSKCAQVLGSHKVIVYPLSYRWEGDRMIINEVGMVQKT